jgi:hypothetical protein
MKLSDHQKAVLVAGLMGQITANPGRSYERRYELGDANVTTTVRWLFDQQVVRFELDLNLMSNTFIIFEPWVRYNEIE